MDMKAERRRILLDGVYKNIFKQFDDIARSGVSGAKGQNDQNVRLNVDRIVKRCNNIYELLGELELLGDLTKQVDFVPNPELLRETPDVPVPAGPIGTEDFYDK